jgi:hypothetical protein
MIDGFYYYITDMCTIGKDFYTGHKRDKYREITGNVFKNYKECYCVLCSLKKQIMI